MMNILMSANQDVMSGVELVLYTLLTHNKNCRIYIATMDIDVRINDNGGMIHYNGKWVYGVIADTIVGDLMITENLRSKEFREQMIMPV